MRLQVGGAPLDKLSVVVPTITAYAEQTEIYTLTNSVPTRPTPPSPLFFTLAGLDDKAGSSFYLL